MMGTDSNKVKCCHWMHNLWLKGYLFLGLMGIVFNAAAYNNSDSVPLNVTGSIYASSCTVTFPGDINLGTYYRQNISIAGANTSDIPVTVSLTDCSPFISKATASFSGTAYTEDAGYESILYANSIAGGAQDLGLQLLSSDPVVTLGNNANYVINIDSSTKSASLNITARMYTPHGSPTAGDFSAAVTINFTYQ
ncbi:fimbrial protein SthD [Budviciaceae bacterium BWR-B9]|uniref:Fimbrial protein SthD n=1 Tax=Limnobaculum allomyrinae TaxID=2791986 RepID=A0ABS1IN01_9GAMM|nr:MULTISPECIES: fimbrial protein [Limnobaculum]MBK5142705.1 fimbrial protein SthD [Limnobaculum allomyrinae]MBV7690408.1 fimbrial protein SthD [Limnobaculum sp. M2-1]